MSVFAVYESSTGVVVGGVKVIGTAAPTVATLVGDALPVRVTLDAGVAALSLPGTELAVHEADDQPEVFTDPLAYGVTRLPAQPPKPALAKLPSIDAPTFDGTGLVVTLKGDAAQDTAVFALVSEGTETLPVTGTVAKGANDVRIPVTVSAGAHAVLLLVAGRAGRLDEVEKP
jgi:hypothetical protein